MGKRVALAAGITMIILSGMGIKDMKAMEHQSGKWFELLPVQIDGWSASDRDKSYTRATIFNYMNGAGEMYLAYEFKKLFVREYTRPSAPPIIAEIYEMNSSGDAYGVFTNDTDGKPVRMGQGGIYSQGLLRFWKGSIFVRLMTERETGETRTAVMNLGREIVDGIADDGATPGLLSYLPPDGLLDKSIQYFHTQVTLNFLYFLANTNLLNLNPETEVILARYTREDRKVRLLLVSYSNAVLAKTAYEQFNRVYFPDQPGSAGSMRIESVENDEYVSIRLSDRYLIMVFESKDQKTCVWLSDAVEKRLKGA